MDSSSIYDNYTVWAGSYKALEVREDRILFILSLLRLLIFAGGLALIWIAFTLNRLAGMLLTAALPVLFIYILIVYSRHSEKKRFFGNLYRINTNEASAVGGDINCFESGRNYADPGHDFSDDIDLFGPGSLFQYLNRTVTGFGRDVLAGWLTDPFRLSPEMRTRQEAIAELSRKREWRQHFMALGIDQPLEKSNISDLMEWICEKEVARTAVFKFFLIYFMPALAVITLGLAISGLVHYTFFSFIFLTNLLVVAAGLRKTNRIHRSLTGIHIYLSSLHRLLKIFDREDFGSAVLNDIQRNISRGRTSASSSIRKLSGLIQSFDSRLNLMLGFILNGLLLWDYQNVFRLEKWKSEFRDLLPVWLEMVGIVDAYSSLANYAFNNPEFAYPVVREDGVLLTATRLGHPLIRAGHRVCNDFSIEKKGEISIITGANMSGKSTFLRTIAVNYILGMTGSPVCAGRMHFVPLKLFTSMRTTDSLANNESYFYAELKRLKRLKSLIEEREPILFILDEILKGTNSADKSMGSGLFIRRIISLEGTGLIATHDTSLGGLENDFPGKVKNMCFEIEIDGDKVNFSYMLRPGITRTMNATLLMRQMGILG